jgi:putative transposase
MEYDNINISDIEEIIAQTVKEKIENIMKIEQDQYLEENPRIKNGTYKRNLKTKYGELKELSVPRNRDNSFHSAILDENKSIGLEELITSMYSNGVSTRSVNSVINNLGVNVSPEYVSSLNKELDAKVKEFLETKIEDKIVYLYIDAAYFKIRENGRYRSMALYVSIGVNSRGIRQILSMDIYSSENEMDWNNFFYKLQERGLSGVKLVISDGHKGIMKSVQESLPGSLWQYCHFHFLKNLRKTRGRDQ